MRNTRCTVASSVVDAVALREALAQLAGGTGAGAASDAPAGRSAHEADGPLLLVDAFAVPRVLFDPVRRSFHRHVPRCRCRCCAWPQLTRRRRCSSQAASRVLAQPDSKVSLYRERFHLVSQRLGRSKLFSRPALGGSGGGGGHCTLTPLQALLGTAGATHFVLGALSLLDDGRYWLEDTTGSVAVDLAGAATAAGLFTENCVVVAEGALRRDGVFEARSALLALFLCCA